MKRFGIGLVIGLLVAGFSAFGVYKWAVQKNEKVERNDYYIIANQIQKMNKMVVIEQDFSSMQRTKMSRELLGGTIPGTEKSIITYTKTNAQVSYDLNKMKIEVDSIQKKLIIRELPEPQIRIIPSVEIQSMDNALLSSFDEDEIKKVTQTAKENAHKMVDKSKLLQAGHHQLKENLQQIFVLAKALDYTIEDQTSTLKL